MRVIFLYFSCFISIMLHAGEKNSSKEIYLGQSNESGKGGLIFQASTFMDPKLYKLSLRELNTKMKSFVFRGFGLSLTSKNSVFPSATRWGLGYNKDGLKLLSFNFLKKNPTEESAKTIHIKILKELTDRYGEFLILDEPFRGAQYYYWKTKEGLSILLETQAKTNYKYVRIYISDYFSRIKINYRKYDPELLNLQERSFKIDDLFEPLLYTVPLDIANKHLKTGFKGKGEQFFREASQQSVMFEESDYRESKVVYDETGLQYLRIVFPSKKRDVGSLFRKILRKCELQLGYKKPKGFRPSNKKYQQFSFTTKIRLYVQVEMVTTKKDGYYVTLKVSDGYKKVVREEYEK